MRHAWVLIMPSMVVGCATQPTTTTVATTMPPPSVAVVAAAKTKIVETRYEVRGYQDSADRAVWHDAHAVFRRTKVPVTATEDVGTVPRTTFAPASYAPLPASDELIAELATQKKITSDLRAMQSSMVETEQRMQVQYATVVRQSAEAMRVRAQLEAERMRDRDATPSETPVTQANTTSGKSAEIKW